MEAGAQNQRKRPVLFHPDYTVGPGIAPDLLTSLLGDRSRALAFAIYRRWGIAPRPENIAIVR